MDTCQIPNNTNEDCHSSNIIVTTARGTTPASFTATATAVDNWKNDDRGNSSVMNLGILESLRHDISGKGNDDGTAAKDAADVSYFTNRHLIHFIGQIVFGGMVSNSR